MMIVLFKTKSRADVDQAEYQKTAARMWELGTNMPGFVSFESYTGSDGASLSIVRFDSVEALEAWRTHPEHLAAQRRAREAFYASYSVQVCTSIREYEWRPEASDTT